MANARPLTESEILGRNGIESKREREYFEMQERQTKGGKMGGTKPKDGEYAPGYPVGGYKIVHIKLHRMRGREKKFVYLAYAFPNHTPAANVVNEAGSGDIALIYAPPIRTATARSLMLPQKSRKTIQSSTDIIEKIIKIKFKEMGYIVTFQHQIGHMRSRGRKTFKAGGKWGGYKISESFRRGEGATKVVINGKTYYAKVDSMGALHVWSKRDFEKRKDATWYYQDFGEIKESNNLSGDEEEAVRFLESGGAFGGAKMQWHGYEVTGAGGSVRPMHFAYKQRQTKMFKLKDGRTIRFEKAVFNPKGMVMRK